MKTLPTTELVAAVLLYRLKITCRVALGFVWFWEGLVPKVLLPNDVQFAMVRHSGLWWGTPEMTLSWVGWGMVAAGLVIMSGYRERLAVLVATLTLLPLMALVIVNQPLALTDPYGGLAKDACLFACAAVVWWLAPIVPCQRFIFPSPPAAAATTSSPAPPRASPLVGKSF